jgi:hypothetical protein
MNCRIITAVMFLVLIASWPPILPAQTTNATVTGFVTDPTKSVVVGAKVNVINMDTNIRYAASTNQDGIYAIPNLPPGPYRIEVEKPGFKTVVKSDLVLHVQDTAAINFEMAVGSVSEIVTVQAGTPSMNTTDGSVGTMVDSNFVANMPLNGRSFQDLILLTPGVVTNSPQTTGTNGSSGEFSVNGQRTESNYYTVDGVSANTGVLAGVIYTPGASGSLPASTSLGTTQALAMGVVRRLVEAAEAG